jgi:hypothetical protein
MTYAAMKERKPLRLDGKEEHDRELQAPTLPDRHPPPAKREHRKDSTNHQGNE